MCINVKYIYTRSRLISKFHSERYLVPIKCGQCVECQTERQQQYYFRIYHEWKSTLQHNPKAFVLFDTLTYDDDHLPHISDNIDLSGIEFPDNEEVDFPCFSRSDLRLFFVRLRRRLSYYGYKSAGHLKYLVCSEYGKDDYYHDSFGRLRKGTNRPHYHVLFFSTFDIAVGDLKSAIDYCWQNGRTDKLRRYGYHKNVFYGSDSDRSILGVAHYVSQYVQKSSEYSRQVDRRINAVMHEAYLAHEKLCYSRTKENDDLVVSDTVYNRYFPPRLAVSYKEVPYTYGNWCRSIYAKQLRNSLVHTIKQFMLSSKGFGISALSEIDLLHLYRTGMVTMPDTNSLVRSIPIPKYYERKLFEELVTFDNGLKVWQKTSEGQLYAHKKKVLSFDLLSKKYESLYRNYGYYPCDPVDLARYVVYKKGYLKGVLDYEPTFTEKLDFPCWCNYTCPLDVHLYHMPLISNDFLGLASTLGRWYHVDLRPRDCLLVKDFVSKYVYSDPFFDSILDHLASLQVIENQHRQTAFDNLQRLRNIYK